MYLLGYELNSRHLKVVLINSENHQVKAHSEYPKQPIETITKQVGWAEQQPEIWWLALCMATRKLLRENEVKPNEIKAIGISYQMHGLVLVDEDHEVIRPAIIWSDSRAVDIGELAIESIGRDYCENHLHNLLGNFTAAKLKWIKENEPKNYNKIHKIMLPGDYLALKLTGKASTTISGLSEGIFWDYKKDELSKEVVNKLGFKESFFPPIVPTIGIQGKVNQIASEMTGLNIGTPITFRAGDQLSNAFAVNALEVGEVAANSGVSGTVFGVVDQPIFDPLNRINTFAPVNYLKTNKLYGTLLCINGGGLVFDWAQNQMIRVKKPFSEIDRIIKNTPIGSDGMIFFPFGNGAERMFQNRNILSHTQNIHYRHDRGMIYRSLIEGLAFSFVYGIKLLEKLELDVKIIRACNSDLFQSELFTQTIATLINCPIEIYDTCTLIGTAKAAGVVFEKNKATKELKPLKVINPEEKSYDYQQAYDNWLFHLNKLLKNHKIDTKAADDIIKKEAAYLATIQEKEKKLYEYSIRLISATALLNETKEILTTNSLQVLEKKELQAIIQKLDNFSSGENWADFEPHFNLVHGNLYQRLKTKYLELTASDIKICACIKMKMSSKEIADRLHLSLRTVETKRYRLRQKLQLKKGENLTQFIELF